MTQSLEQLLREFGFGETEKDHDLVVDTLLDYGDVRTFVQEQHDLELPHYIACLADGKKCYEVGRTRPNTN